MLNFLVGKFSTAPHQFMGVSVADLFCPFCNFILCKTV